MQRIFLLTIILHFIFINTNAQNIISTSGAYTETDVGSLSYTIGELTIETLTNETNILTQGFQQSRIIVTSIDNLINNKLEVLIFPNPANEFLTIKLKELNKARIQLFDIQGQLLLTGDINNNETIISFSNYGTGMYILNVIDSKRNIKTFQIIKQ